MRTSLSSKKEKKKPNVSPSFKKYKRPKLQDILEDIKSIQYYVSNLCISKNKSKQSSQKKIDITHKKQYKNQSNHKIRSISHKQQFEEDAVIKNPFSIITARKNKSALMNNSSIFTTKFPQKSSSFHKIENTDNLSENFIKSQILHEEIPYISLHLQNLNLSKHNLQLENKLLQQQLMIQKKQKMILKSRLKRMKTNNVSNMAVKEVSHSRTNQSSIKQGYRERDRIIISIPQFRPDQIVQHHQQSIQRNNYFTFNEIKKKENSESQELLLSDSDFERFNILKEKRNDKLLQSKNNNKQYNVSLDKKEDLQREFWTILDKSEKQNCKKRWELRQTAGEIASKLKTIRKK